MLKKLVEKYAERYLKTRLEFLEVQMGINDAERLRSENEWREKILAHNRLIEGWLKAFCTQAGVELPK
jgi:hypothetical protein